MNVTQTKSATPGAATPCESTSKLELVSKSKIYLGARSERKTTESPFTSSWVSQPSSFLSALTWRRMRSRKKGRGWKLWNFARLRRKVIGLVAKQNHLSWGVPDCQQVLLTLCQIRYRKGCKLKLISERTGTVGAMNNHWLPRTQQNKALLHSWLDRIQTTWRTRNTLWLRMTRRKNNSSAAPSHLDVSDLALTLS